MISSATKIINVGPVRRQPQPAFRGLHVRMSLLEKDLLIRLAKAEHRSLADQIIHMAVKAVRENGVDVPEAYKKHKRRFPQSREISKTLKGCTMALSNTVRAAQSQPIPLLGVVSPRKHTSRHLRFPASDSYFLHHPPENLDVPGNLPPVG
jgi:hypothetical protein